MFGCLWLSLVGIVSITRLAFFFGEEKDETWAGVDYHHGTRFACGAAVMGNLLPVLTC